MISNERRIQAGDDIPAGQHERTRPLSRRHFLRASGGSLLGASLAGLTTACTSGGSNAAKPAEVTVMWNLGEFAEADVKLFESTHPNIKLNLIADDPTKLSAMFASGNPPDIFRVQAPSIPQFIARRMIRPLTKYFESSKVLSLSNLAPANDYYKWDGKQTGKGDIYGMVKDWSPDFTIFCYTDAFRGAKIDVPSLTDSLTYDQIRGIAAKLSETRGEGGRPRYRGFVHSNDLGWFDRVVMNMLAEKGQTLYTADFGQVNITKNQDTVAILRYFFDLHKAQLDINPLNPSTSWGGEEFTAGKVGMVQYGYWFSGMAETEVTKGKVVMLPAPTWAGVRRDPTITATGGVISARSKNPDAAWEVFEYYMGGKPAQDRAASGWGVPGLKSLYERMPTSTPFQTQVQQVLAKELKLETQPLGFNPYLGEAAFSNAYKKHLEQAMRDRISFDEMLQRVEKEVNDLISEGKNR